MLLLNPEPLNSEPNSSAGVGRPAVVAELNTFFDPAARHRQGDPKGGRGGAEQGYAVVCQQIKGF